MTIVVMIMEMVMKKVMMTIIVITAGNNLSVGWHRVEAAAEDDPSPLSLFSPLHPLP